VRLGVPFSLGSGINPSREVTMIELTDEQTSVLKQG
jgi:hypothetical protein